MGRKWWQAAEGAPDAKRRPEDEQESNYRTPGGVKILSGPPVRGIAYSEANKKIKKTPRPAREKRSFSLRQLFHDMFHFEKNRDDLSDPNHVKILTGRGATIAPNPKIAKAQAKKPAPKRISTTRPEGFWKNLVFQFSRNKDDTARPGEEVKFLSGPHASAVQNATYIQPPPIGNKNDLGVATIESPAAADTQAKHTISVVTNKVGLKEIGLIAFHPRLSLRILKSGADLRNMGTKAKLANIAAQLQDSPKPPGT